MGFYFNNKAVFKKIKSFFKKNNIYFFLFSIMLIICNLHSVFMRL